MTMPLVGRDGQSTTLMMTFGTGVIRHTAEVGFMFVCFF